MLTQIKNKAKSQKGFTLIELMVVILIIGVLAGIAVPKYIESTENARGARIQADLRTIDSAIVLFQVSNNGESPTPTTIIGREAGGTTAAPITALKGTLAKWPTPPSGKYKTPRMSNAVEMPADTKYDIVANRAVLGTNGTTTADDL